MRTPSLEAPTRFSNLTPGAQIPRTALGLAVPLLTVIGPSFLTSQWGGRCVHTLRCEVWRETQQPAFLGMDAEGINHRRAGGGQGGIGVKAVL
ncbi:unnamed protein product [Arctogadus glacialis]